MNLVANTGSTPGLTGVSQPSNLTLAGYADPDGGGLCPVRPAGADPVSELTGSGQGRVG